ncbi:MAG: CDP-alcohol phosphatidyltransferase family protein [Ruminococcaceae bacterium]|nr:CDP-alcohol phosphatidyltransferase family protein [Oscillospiraceae bacterium]
MIPKFVLNVPNTLTLLRLLAIPVLAAVIYAGDQYNTLALILFLAIWVTDLLDGWIARRFNQMTEFGKLFDPLVDKLFQFTTALMLYIVGKLPFWVPAFIFVRELLMIIGSAILLRHGKIVVQSKWYGKLSTVLFVAAFAVFFVLPADQRYLGKYIFLVPIIWSIFAYFRYYQTAVKPWLLRKLAERKKNESQR